MKSVEMIEEGLTSLYPGSQLMSEKMGYVKIRKGERFVYSKCAEIHQYQPRWDRSFTENGKRKCTHELPINFDGKMKFLYLPSKQLHNVPSYRKCDDNDFYFVQGSNSSLYKIDGRGSIKLRREHLEVFKYAEKVPELDDIDLNNLHRNESQIAIPMLLRILSQKSNKLQDFLNDDTSASIQPLNKMKNEAVEHVKSWMQREVWDPIKKYIAIGAGILFVLIMAIIIHRCIIPAFKKRRSRRREESPIIEMSNLWGYTPPEERRLITSISMDGIDTRMARARTKSFVLVPQTGASPQEV